MHFTSKNILYYIFQPSATGQGYIGKVRRKVQILVQVESCCHSPTDACFFLTFASKSLVMFLFFELQI